MLFDVSPMVVETFRDFQVAVVHVTFQWMNFIWITEWINGVSRSHTFFNAMIWPVWLSFVFGSFIFHTTAVCQLHILCVLVKWLCLVDGYKHQSSWKAFVFASCPQEFAFCHSQWKKQPLSPSRFKNLKRRTTVEDAQKREKKAQGAENKTRKAALSILRYLIGKAIELDKARTRSGKVCDIYLVFEWGNLGALNKAKKQLRLPAIWMGKLSNRKTSPRSSFVFEKQVRERRARAAWQELRTEHAPWKLLYMPRLPSFASHQAKRKALNDDRRGARNCPVKRKPAERVSDMLCGCPTGKKIDPSMVVQHKWLQPSFKKKEEINTKSYWK